MDFYPSLHINNKYSARICQNKTNFVAALLCIKEHRRLALQRKNVLLILFTYLLMNSILLINKYYPDNPELLDLLLRHSRAVADKALAIASNHPEMNLDLSFIEEAAMVHDIGIFRTDAPGICCYGTEPYICHGILGAELLRKEGFPKHARVAERHTGAGITAADIISQNLPLPENDYMPETLEEKLICYADKFFSKSRPDIEKTLEGARKSLRKFGGETMQRFDEMVIMFE